MEQVFGERLELGGDEKGISPIFNWTYPLFCPLGDQSSFREGPLSGALLRLRKRVASPFLPNNLDLSPFPLLLEDSAALSAEDEEHRGADSLAVSQRDQHGRF